MENWILEEDDWSLTYNAEDEDWCIPEIEEIRAKRNKIEDEKEKLLMRRKLPLANLSGAELRQEALRIIVELGLYPEEEIHSVHYRKRQVGCKDKNILTDHRVTTTTEKAESSGEGITKEKAESSGEGITKEALAKPGPDE